MTRPPYRRGLRTVPCTLRLSATIHRVLVAEGRKRHLWISQVVEEHLRQTLPGLSPAEEMASEPADISGLQNGRHRCQVTLDDRLWEAMRRYAAYHRWSVDGAVRHLLVVALEHAAASLTIANGGSPSASDPSFGPHSNPGVGPMLEVADRLARTDNETWVGSTQAATDQIHSPSRKDS